MVRHSLTPIQKTGNLVVRKDAPDQPLIALEVPHEHRGFAIAPSRPDKPKNFPRRLDHLPFQIAAGHHAQGPLPRRLSLLRRRERSRQPIRPGFNPRLGRVPKLLQMPQHRAGLKAGLSPLTRQTQAGEPGSGHRRQHLLTAPMVLQRQGPAREPRHLLPGLIFETKCEGNLVAMGGHGRQEIHLLQRKLREAIHPKTTPASGRWGLFRGRDGWFAQGFRGRVQQRVGILQLMPRQPLIIQFGQNRQVLQFVSQAALGLDFGRQRPQERRRHLGPLQFAQHQAELLRKTRQPCARAKQLQLLAVPRQQTSQYHHPAFLFKERRPGQTAPLEGGVCQPLEG